MTRRSRRSVGPRRRPARRPRRGGRPCRSSAASRALPKPSRAPPAGDAAAARSCRPHRERPPQRSIARSLPGEDDGRHQKLRAIGEELRRGRGANVARSNSANPTSPSGAATSGRGRCRGCAMCAARARSSACQPLARSSSPPASRACAPSGRAGRGERGCASPDGDSAAIDDLARRHARPAVPGASRAPRARPPRAARAAVVSRSPWYQSRSPQLLEQLRVVRVAPVHLDQQQRVRRRPRPRAMYAPAGWRSAGSRRSTATPSSRSAASDVRESPDDRPTCLRRGAPRSRQPSRHEKRGQCARSAAQPRT